jgi:ankyrin repeat protein
VALVELFLVRGASIDARNLAGATALFGSVENDRPATVALLLAKGADPNLPGRSGVTPLAAAAFRGNDRIVQQLLAGGADPDVVDQTGKAAVTYAAARGFSIVVRRLLDAGINARRVYGNDLTALMWGPATRRAWVRAPRLMSSSFCSTPVRRSTPSTTAAVQRS